MGTNYYWSEKEACQTCGHREPARHIGKSSSGWVFALHIYPEDGITDIDDWERLWASGGEIFDEYDKRLSVEDMRLVIMARARPEPWERKPVMYESWQEFHRLNHSEPGPAGLLRSKVDGIHTIRHGAGTWDCHVGDFS